MIYILGEVLGIIFFTYYCVFTPSLILFALIRQFGVRVILNAAFKLCLGTIIKINTTINIIIRELKTEISKRAEDRRNAGMYVDVSNDSDINLDDYDIEMMGVSVPYLNNSGELVMNDEMENDELGY